MRIFNRDAKTSDSAAILSSLDDINRELAALRSQVGSNRLSNEEASQLERFRLERTLFANWPGRSSADLLERVRAIMQQLRPFRAKGHAKVRVGSANDGGYVLLDDIARIGFALSFGVERNADFDLQMAERGVSVRQYDHTIEHAPAHHRLITWEKKQIAPTLRPGCETIGHILETLPPPAKQSGVLKIDIEHAEWDVFDQVASDDLDAFAQIVGEFHGFDYLADPALLAKVERVVAKLTEKFAVFHVHANNHCGVTNYFGLAVPYVLELSFANRCLYAFEPSDEVFPGELDAPCDPTKPDIWLNRFHF